VSLCRLLLDPPAAGAWNMALDEALLDQACGSSSQVTQPTWRFYRWSEPTLSLGYFQAEADRSEHKASAACPLVRRLTGGGAIVHDQELTYSLVVPAGHPLSIGRDRLYRLVHGALVTALSEFSLSATLCPGGPAAPPEPFLCFQRRALGDVLLGNDKIAGSAQRRRRGAVLQHGSLLLRHSAAAPELPGLEDLSDQAFPIDRLIPVWLTALSSTLQLEFTPGSITDEERSRATAIFSRGDAESRRES
jgi:lipoate-protein ligase A